MTEFRVDASQPKMSATPEGYLRGDAVVSRVGVFEYQNADGSTRLELRHPDEVFKPESLATLKQIPVTLGHPSTMVSASNARQYQVGQTGDVVNVDGELMTVGFTITHDHAVSAVNNKDAQQLSLGYSLDLVPEQGTYKGSPYTHRQTNIHYNHLALVKQARAGAAATINMDGIIEFYNEPKEPLTVTLKPFNLDGIEYQASPEIINHINKLATANADAGKSMEDMKKAMDEAKGKYDSLKAEYDKAKTSNSDEAITAAVTSRLALIEQASKLTANVDGFVAFDDKTIMIKAIQAKTPEFNADGKSIDYVQSRFDTMIELAQSADKVPASVTGQRADGEGALKPPVVNNFDSFLSRADATKGTK